MRADTVKTIPEALENALRVRRGGQGLVFQYDEDHEQVVRHSLPVRLGLTSVPEDELYKVLQQLVNEGKIIEEFGDRKVRAGIADFVYQPYVTYRLHPSRLKAR